MKAAMQNCNKHEESRKHLFPKDNNIPTITELKGMVICELADNSK